MSLHRAAQRCARTWAGSPGRPLGTCGLGAWKVTLLPANRGWHCISGVGKGLPEAWGSEERLGLGTGQHGCACAPETQGRACPLCSPNFTCRPVNEQVSGQRTASIQPPALVVDTGLQTRQQPPASYRTFHWDISRTVSLRRVPAASSPQGRWRPLAAGPRVAVC